MLVNHDACHRVVLGDDLAAEVAEPDGLLTHLVCLPACRYGGRRALLRRRPGRGARRSPCPKDPPLSNVCSIEYGRQAAHGGPAHERDRTWERLHMGEAAHGRGCTWERLHC